MAPADIDGLRRELTGRFGSAGPDAIVVRAPGRVNLIGEHIDYNGLPVFPMAVQRHITLACRPRADHTMRVVSLTPGFEPREFVIDQNIPPGPPGDWGNYLKAPAQALARKHGTLRGFDGVLTSSIPVAAGLSSSSALVVSVGLALVHLNQLAVQIVPLAEELARAERYIGTQGGGMDHAICLGARSGTTTRIDFHPLRLAARSVPPAWRIVVASSLDRAEKSGAAQALYNDRTRECAVALAAVTARLGLTGSGYRELLRAGSRDRLLAAGDQVLTDPVRRRYRHVLTEAYRVSEAEDALVAADLTAFGRRLSASHASLRDDYEVSTPALDQLVAIAAGAGAAGARLTGAGMGGCIVAVCEEKTLGSVLSALQKQFYGPRAIENAQEEHYFVAEPSHGARVAPLTGDG